MRRHVTDTHPPCLTHPGLLDDAVTRSGRGLDDVAVWAAFGSMTGGPVLELGAGTARVLQGLLEAGLDADGIEIDPDVRAVGLERLRDAGVADAGARLRLGDMRAFDLRRRYALTVIAFNTLALLDDRDALRALQCAREHARSATALRPRWRAIGRRPGVGDPPATARPARTDGEDAPLRWRGAVVRGARPPRGGRAGRAPNLHPGAG